MMEGKGCQAKDMASAIFDRSYSLPQQFSTADVVVRTKCYPGSQSVLKCATSTCLGLPH